MFSMEEICDALATRYVGTVIGTPSGAAPMRAAYGRLPNNIPATPAVVVAPKSGSVVYAANWWDMVHQIDVLFYHSKRQGDIPRSETERQRWLPRLLSATHGALTLGGKVKKAIPSGYEFGTLNYGGDEYDGIVAHFDVYVGEGVSLAP